MTGPVEPVVVLHLSVRECNRLTKLLVRDIRRQRRRQETAEPDLAAELERQIDEVSELRNELVAARGEARRRDDPGDAATEPDVSVTHLLVADEETACGLPVDDSPLGLELSFTDDPDVPVTCPRCRRP